MSSYSFILCGRRRLAVLDAAAIKEQVEKVSRLRECFIQDPKLALYYHAGDVPPTDDERRPGEAPGAAEDAQAASEETRAAEAVPQADGSQEPPAPAAEAEETGPASVTAETRPAEEAPRPAADLGAQAGEPAPAAAPLPSEAATPESSRSSSAEADSQQEEEDTPQGGGGQ